MKRQSLLVLFFIASCSMLINSCSQKQPMQSLRWPPDTITAVHVGGDTYVISSGTFLTKTKMRVVFTWPKFSDTTATRSLVAMRVPVPWPPDTTFYPIRIKLVGLTKPDSLK
ncbi:MAG: hypothetical protein M1469_04310 [Bacteroidetes bacterium]|nr:hypothetical protein [Bacteroidota bacterium]